MSKVIAITGSSGFIGKEISTYFNSQGDRIIRISREVVRDREKLHTIVNQADVVINLAGAPIVARWTKKKKGNIVDSRVETTRMIVSAFNTADEPPAIFVSASAVGLYDTHHEHTEASRNVKNNFLAQVVQQWEKEAEKIRTKKTRVIIFRLGIVLGRNGGMMKKMMTIINFGLGAILGSGKQSFPFVHIEDVIEAIKHVMMFEKSAGIYNLVAPFHATNQVFTKMMAKKMQRPVFLRIPERLLQVVFLDGATVLSEGQKVIPERLLSEGFIFQYDTLDSCLENIVKQ